MVKRFLSTVIIGAMAIVAMAQTQQNIRYVCNNNDAVRENGQSGDVIGYHVKGKYANDGQSWATAKDNIQDAINDLVGNKLTGEVWVTSGTYYPTETTESSGGSTQYMSFKIPAGITVRGGFKGLLVKNKAGSAENKALGADSVYYVGETKYTDRDSVAATNEGSSAGMYYKYFTVLDGSINSSHTKATFTWNATKHQYTTEFYGNSYHVVTFATEGFDSDGRAKPLGTEAEIRAGGGYLAKLEGVHVRNGYAFNKSTDGHPHNAYGGGVYMVPGACLETSAVEYCEASRDGGGIYLDGGGLVNHCYVAACQAVGVNLSTGYGGGICVEENKQAYPPVVKRSCALNCVARYGGGMANKVNNQTTKVTDATGKSCDMRYNEGFYANVVAGNTALTDGGGVYALNGGTFTHMTIVRNRCYGNGTSVNGIKSGQSAGFYARNDVFLANSILWGGVIESKYESATSDKSTQFASSRSSSSNQSEVLYTALSNFDRTDWTGVVASGNVKLSSFNTSTAESTAGAAHNTEEGYVAFVNPLATAGYLVNSESLHFLPISSGGYSYKVSYGSAVTNVGVPSSDLDTENKTPISGVSLDVFGSKFSSNPTLGAYTSLPPTMGPDIEVTSETKEYNGTTYPVGIVHIFVDPNTNYAETSADVETSRYGSSWTTPVKNLRDAIQQIATRAPSLINLIESGSSNVFTGTAKKVIVHVKEGTTTVQGANVSGSVRTTSIEIPSMKVKHLWDTDSTTLELEIIGGYKSNITDNIYSSTNTSGYDNTTANFPARHGYAQASVRNPILYPTIITGYIMDEYSYCTPHIFKIEDKGETKVTIDGIQVRYANAWSTLLGNKVTTGAAFTIKNSQAVTLKNVLIADCQATNGAAIYETDNSIVSLENCIIHNNAVKIDGFDGLNFEKAGIIYTERGSSVTLNHCDVLRNVGYAFYNDGTVTMDNSICYANMSTALDDTNGNADKAMKTFAGSGTVSSENSKNLFDTGSANDTKATGIGTANQTFVYADNTSNHYPGLDNSTKNSGVSEDGDATYYGRTTSFQPMNNNDMVNSASASGSHETWGTDMSTNITRDYGGLPDIGAVENHKAAVVDEGDFAATDGQPEYGSLYYVRYYDGDLSKGGDGMSWTNAINGNAYYDESTGDFYGSEATHTSASGGHWEYGDPVTTRTLGIATTNIETGKKYLLRKKGESVYAKLGTSKVQSATLFTWGTTDAQTADVFTFKQGSYDEWTRSGRDWIKNTVTSYIIEDNTLTKYFQYDPSKGTEASNSYNYYQMTMSGNKIKFHSVNGGWDRYLDIETKSTGGGPNSQNIQVIYQTDTESHGQDWEWIPFTESTETPKTWVEETTTYNHIKGLQYAVNKASQRSLTGYNTEVWVGAGTYKSNLVWKDGANVYGGFPATGTPGKNQRDISNSNTTYKTIIDGNASGRVLTQNAVFTNSTLFEGFTIQNGATSGKSYGAGAYILENGVLANCLISENAFTSNSNSEDNYGGGGLYVGASGIVKNCKIINNTLTNSNTSNNRNGYNYHVCGAGAYVSGGTIINSLIVENVLTNTKCCTLGAGLGVSTKSNLYNCTIAYNHAVATTDGTGIGSYPATGGVWDFGVTGSSNPDYTNASHFYNCIIWGNYANGSSKENFVQVGMAGFTAGGGSSKDYFKDCYHSAANSQRASASYTDQTQTCALDIEDNASKWSDFLTACKNSDNDPFLYVNGTTDYSLKSTGTAVNCINKGGDEGANALAALGIVVDIEGADRIQDCTIDKGAYEYNGAYDITPTVSTDGKEAYFYVTQNGRGIASASSPATAACYQKLQKVIDAAGRYKYQNSDKRVIVKLAGDVNNTGFKYKPCRSIDASSTDQRNWSIMIPRGVEVWGGYTDAYTDDNNNGFTIARDIINHPTYFNGNYTNTSSNASVYAYHVVTFTDNIFDANGVAYKTVDKNFNGAATTSGTALTLDATTFKRGVVDGIFITGGMADAVSSGKSNENVYGGAAIVNEHGHVRNCIIRGNYANYGGGLALTKGGLVSGCLIDQNTANNIGGGIYVLTEEENKNIGYTAEYLNSLEKPYVYTSTIVNNLAGTKGGGIAFDDKDNVRVNSSVIWQNSSSALQNVSGIYDPEKPTEDTTPTDEFYPFAYTAVMNLRLDGTNNISLAPENKNGARFWKNGDSSDETLASVNNNASTNFAKYDDFGLYRLTNISNLLRIGMPVSSYEGLVTSKGLAANDFADVARDVTVAGSLARTYIDMGARAWAKQIKDNELMLRLYVVDGQNEDAMDADAANALMSCSDSYYSQEGSSFGYPFQSLQDALDYIILKRGTDKVSTTNAQYLPFEIVVGQGTYYPTKDLAGNYGMSLSNTFAIPEGVSIYGGFDAKELGSNKFYGRYYTPKTSLTTSPNYGEDMKLKSFDLKSNVDSLSTNLKASDFTYEVDGTKYTICQWSSKQMLKDRKHADDNNNSIIEPWEFQYETILSGNVTGDEDNGVFHVVTVIPDQNIVGVLPPKNIDRTLSDNLGYKYDGSGYTDHEEGQAVNLNGIIITEGCAQNFFSASDMDEMSKYNYYHGGGLLVDGNRYCNDYNNGTTHGTQYLQTGKSNTVGYRDCVVNIINCKFLKNSAGYGGAISANTTINVYNSAFEQNLATYGEDKGVPCSYTVGSENKTAVDIKYPGQGGAIFSTHHISAYNTLFANNEAQNSLYDLGGQTYPTYRNPTISTRIIGGCGGAIYSGLHGYFHLVNCDVVRNKANVLPAVATMNPNVYPVSYDEEEEVYSEVYKTGYCNMSLYNQFLNTIVWGNELNETMVARFKDNSVYPCFNFAAKLICNYGKARRTEDYTFDFTGKSGTMPKSSEELNELDTQVGDTKYMETAWFSAYEDGLGMKAENTADLRNAQFRPFYHAKRQIVEATVTSSNINGDPRQNCNIEIDSDNSNLDGPNFVSPSGSAGYAGYDQSSDWSPTRINNLTDQGSGKIMQSATPNNNKGSYDCSFLTYSGVGKSIAGYWGTEEATIRSNYSNETSADYITSGAYTTAHFISSSDPLRSMPLGTDDYMKSSLGQELYRISYDPNTNCTASYIDIGVYEYPHTQLVPTTESDEVDILWVSSEEKPDNGLPEGSSWTRPTSDLQRAIETLLSSRNGHRKEIRLMDGEFSPLYTIGDKLAFCFDTKYVNSGVILPKINDNITEGLGVRSFTIKGGYSKDLNGLYNVDEYPAVIRQKTHTTTNTDYLFYIKDATQRYGSKSGYTSGNGYGWWCSSSVTNGSAPNTIPIEIDGVTFVNNQASEDSQAKGCAIYYADQTFDSDLNQKDGLSSPTNTAAKPTNAHISKYDSEGKRMSEYLDQADPYKLIISKCKVMNSGILTKTASNMGAVFISKYGGESLIYNSIFHSNYGCPLQAFATTTINNTFALNGRNVRLTDFGSYYSKIFNSVFWKNNKSDANSGYNPQFKVTLAGETSTLYDCAINGGGAIVSPYSYIKYNAYTNGNTSAIDYEEGSNTIIKGNNFNVGLTDENADAVYGPNFTNPAEDATTDEEIESRDFTIKPSIRLLNRGSNDLYVNDLTKTYNIYDYAWDTTTGYDAVGEKRFVSGYIDLGACEYQSQQNRVIYVDPNAVVSGDGLSWGRPLGYGQIQNAIDLAAVYYKNNKKQAYVFVKANSPSNIDQHTDETISLRNGVSVYGSVVSDYNVECPYTQEVAGGDYIYSDARLVDYCNELTVYHRNGVMSPSEGHTKILGINATGTIFDESATCNMTDDDGNVTETCKPISLLDGFDVTAKTDVNATGLAEVKEPIISIDPYKTDVNKATGGLKMCVRNVVVHDNNLTVTGNIANVNNALLYEALFYNNKVTNGVVLNLDNDGATTSSSDYGYAVNVTVEGTTKGADLSTSLNNVSGSDNNVSGNTNVSHVYNSITNYANDETTWKTLSGYCYKMNEQSLNYQLTEKSKYIDCISLGTKDSPSQSSVLGDMPGNLSCFVNYWPVWNGSGWTSADRDVLGNFRLQTLGTVAGGKYCEANNTYVPKLDRGAFETWDVQRSTLNVFPDFSHDGSVEYIRSGKSFIIDPIVKGVVNSAHEPGFVLLEEGANLYGNGRIVNLGYVAIERKVSNYESVVAMPFRMNYSTFQNTTSAMQNTTVGVGIPNYDANGVLSLTSVSNTAYTYDGETRSGSDYVFNTGVSGNSSCWKSTTDDVPAAQGVLLVLPQDFDKTKTIRFTGCGTSFNDNIYMEQVNYYDNHVYQPVTLTKHDDITSTNGGADFTDANDQGWNCIGLPYLVSDYRPYNKAGVTINSNPADNQPYVTVNVYGPTETPTEALNSYEMANPHTLWLFYDGTISQDAVNGDGGFYSVSSWLNNDWHQASTEDAKIWMGEGFFVQNQDWEGDETLKFYVPVAPTLGTSGSAKKVTESFNTRYYYETDITAPTDNGDERTYKIRVINRTLTVSNLEGGENIRLYNSAGQLLQSAEAESETYRTNVESGVLIVSVNGVSTKFFVK